MKVNVPFAFQTYHKLCLSFWIGFSFLCYIPINMFSAILASTTNRNPANGGETAIYVLPSDTSIRLVI